MKGVLETLAHKHKSDVKQIERAGVYWIHVAQVMDWWRAVENMAMKFRGP